MISRPSIWRERATVWMPAALAVGVGLAFLLLYSAAYANRVTSLRARLSVDVEELGALRAETARLDGIRQRIGVNESRLAALYGTHFGTERERFTAMVSEVKELARRSGLEPGSISYPKTEILRQGLVRKGVVFSVDGTYEALRRFLNLTELSDQFLAVETIGLGANSGNADGGVLEINLTLSAWFKVDPRDVPAGDRSELPQTAVVGAETPEAAR